MTVLMTVAFGASDNSYFIAAGGRTFYNQIPDGMKADLAGKIKHPIEYASIGESGKWFLLGHSLTDSTKKITRFNADILTKLGDQLKKENTTGVSFGPGKSWCWFCRNGSSYRWMYGNFDNNQVAWVNRMKSEDECFRMFIGAGYATVLLFSNGRISYYACGDKTGNALSAAGRKGLSIRYIALSPTHYDWFFIQFNDGSVTWFTSQEIGAHLKDIAKDKGIHIRKADTLD